MFLFKIISSCCPIFAPDFTLSISQAIKESMVMILIHHIANLLMIVPLFVTGAIWNQLEYEGISSILSAENVFAKHQENIINEVNIFEKEEEAVSLLTMLEWMMPLGIHITSLLDVFLAIVYQKYFHPWRRILVGDVVKEWILRMAFVCRNPRKRLKKCQEHLSKRWAKCRG